ncbi:MAG: DUF882 domain-containing protein [Burkholderiales bacterium]
MNKPTFPPPHFEHHAARRHFLRHAAGLAVAGAAVARAQRVQAAVASRPDARRLDFSHTHTGEQLSLVYAVGSEYLPAALTALNRLLRDHYGGQVGSIDPALFDLLFKVQRELQAGAPFQVISGYRSPVTNTTLRKTRGGGVAKHSLHMEAKAIDIRIAGVALPDLRDAAQSLQGGGVGFYPREQFVHVDTGRVRRW